MRTLVMIRVVIAACLPEVTDGIFKSHTPSAEYLPKYTRLPVTGAGQFTSDELAAATWFDPTVIKRERYVDEDVNTDHAVNYGDTLTWVEELNPRQSLIVRDRPTRAYARGTLQHTPFTRVMKRTPEPASREKLSMSPGTMSR
jgi:hypothetical protein